MLGICLLYLFANRSLRNHFVAVPVDEGLKPIAHRSDPFCSFFGLQHVLSRAGCGNGIGIAVCFPIVHICISEVDEPIEFVKSITVPPLGVHLRKSVDRGSTIFNATISRLID